MREKAARLIRELLTLLERADGQELMQVKCLKKKTLVEPAPSPL